MDHERKVAHLMFRNLLELSKKRKKREEEDFETMLEETEQTSYHGDKEDDVGVIMGAVGYATVLATSNKRGGPREKPLDRTQQKEIWGLGYRS